MQFADPNAHMPPSPWWRGQGPPSCWTGRQRLQKRLGQHPLTLEDPHPSPVPILGPFRMQLRGPSPLPLSTYRQNRRKTKPLLLHLMTSFHIVNSLESDRCC